MFYVKEQSITTLDKINQRRIRAATIRAEKLAEAAAKIEPPPLPKIGRDSPENIGYEMEDTEQEDALSAYYECEPSPTTTKILNTLALSTQHRI